MFDLTIDGKSIDESLCSYSHYIDIIVVCILPHQMVGVYIVVLFM